MGNFHILVDPDKFFLNEDWATIEEVLKPEGEDPNQLTAIMGDKISEFMVFMAVSERMPERIKRKSLAQLAVFIDFQQFARIIRVKFAALQKKPPSETFKRLMRTGRFLPELKYLIANLTLDEMNGLINHILMNETKVNIGVGLAIIERLYDGNMVSKSDLLMILALCRND